MIPVSHLRTISWITGRFKISAWDQRWASSLRGKAASRWKASWAPHGRWPLVGISIQEFLGSETKFKLDLHIIIALSYYDVNNVNCSSNLKSKSDDLTHIFSALRISLYQDFSRQRRSLMESGRKKWVQESALKDPWIYQRNSMIRSPSQIDNLDSRPLVPVPS